MINPVNPERGNQNKEPLLNSYYPVNAERGTQNREPLLNSYNPVNLERGTWNGEPQKGFSVQVSGKYN